MLHRPAGPPDALSAALAHVGFHAVISGAFSAGGEWAVRIPVHTGVKLHALLRGSCWIEYGQTWRRFEAGDCLVTTGSESIVVASEASPREIVPLEGLLASAEDGLVTYQGGDDVFSVTAAVESDGHLPRVLFGGLPPALFVPGHSAEAAVLRWTVEQLRHEFATACAGRSVVVEHLVPILFVQALRVYLASGASDENWLTALAEPRLARALEALHAQYDRPWTLPELAQVAGVSRSSFAALFKRYVGMSPMAYLAHTRVQAARALLRTQTLSVGGVAASVGYRSESAFSVAFERVVGCRPGAYARRQAATGGPPCAASAASMRPHEETTSARPHSASTMCST